ncbi:hypothetical protein EON79_21930 [bacterium]|nr:MAG: hypothetical protein EON79_21930 [bacterium]
MIAAFLLLTQTASAPPKPTRLPGDAAISLRLVRPKVAWLPVVANYDPTDKTFDPAQAGDGVTAGLLHPEKKPTTYTVVTGSKWDAAKSAQGLAKSPAKGKGFDFKRVQAAGQAAGVDYVGMVVLAGAKYGSNPHQSWILLEGVLQVLDVKTGKVAGDPVLVSGSDNNSPHDAPKKYTAIVWKAGYQLGASSAPMQLKATLAKLK